MSCVEGKNFARDDTPATPRRPPVPRFQWRQHFVKRNRNRGLAAAISYQILMISR
jgi:hypothetical protein